MVPNPQKPPISLSIGEPRHPTPRLLLDALAAGAKGLANYPTTAGAPALREAIAEWLKRRHGLISLDPATQVLPVLGSREALFSFAQSVIDSSRAGATVVVPNPFYQIYEGAALLAGATPYYVNSLVADDFAPRWADVPDAVWARTQLLYVCSPDNPTGRVVHQDEWRYLFELADRHVRKLVDGGGPNNVVPDGAVLRVNLRPATVEDQARATSLIEAAVAMVRTAHDVTISASEAHDNGRGGIDVRGSRVRDGGGNRAPRCRVGALCR